MSAIASTLPREATRPPALLAHSARQVGAVLSSVMKLAVPLAAVGLLNMAISVTDSIMIAALGRDLFATGALVSDSQSIVFYFIGSGLMILAPLAAAAASARRDDGGGDLTRLFSAGFGLATLMAAIGFPLVLSIGWLLPAFGIHLPDPDAARRTPARSRFRASPRSTSSSPAASWPRWAMDGRSSSPRRWRCRSMPP
jgi:hypothetical protein